MLKCPQAHSFDIAREGYVNLFISRKRPKIMGDTREMLRARRDFLDQGHYKALSEAINTRVYDHLTNGSPPSPTCVADVGCGEGYYIGRLKRHLDGQPGYDDICYFGLDISKDATGLAAKRYKEIRFVVASVKQELLFSDQSVQVLINVFAPRNAVEFERIIRPDGLLLVTIPNPDHLINLRRDLDLLGIETDKQQRVVEQFAGAFRLTREQAISYEMQLDGQDLSNLIRMSPSNWHVAEKTWNDIKAINSVRAKASFTVLEFQR